MVEKASLVNYITNIGELTQEPAIAKSGSELETAVVSSYEAQRANLKGLHNTKIFDMYVEAEDIDKDQIRRYLAGLKNLQEAVYHTNENSWLRKLAHTTSSWRSKMYEENRRTKADCR